MSRFEGRPIITISAPSSSPRRVARHAVAAPSVAACEKTPARHAAGAVVCDLATYPLPAVPPAVVPRARELPGADAHLPLLLLASPATTGDTRFHGWAGFFTRGPEREDGELETFRVTATRLDGEARPLTGQLAATSLLLTVRVVEAATPRLGIETPRADLVLPAGQIWKLSVGLASSKTAGCGLLVETATLPPWAGDGAEAMAARLLEGLTIEEKEGRLRVVLDRAAIGPELLDAASRVELRRHAWRWDGRPVLPLPVPPGAVAPRPRRELLAWESRALGVLPSGEAPASVAKLTAGEASPVLLDEERLDRRSHYLLVGVTLCSRYRGLIDPRHDSLQGTLPLAGRQSTPWRRFRTACTWPEPVPPPNVKLAVPLSEAVANARTAGLLVVLDEPFFEVGGLSESLELELSPAGPPLKPADGPSGFTFEVDNPAPLFVASSFVFATPPDREFSWYRVEHGLRRRLDTVRSARSEPTHVAFLPASEIFRITAGTRTDDAPLATLHLRVEGDRVRPERVHLQAWDRNVVRLERQDAAAISAARHEYLLLVTRWCPERRGLGERFVGVFDLATGRPVFKPDTTPIGDPTALRARLLEIERPLATLEVPHHFDPHFTHQPSRTASHWHITRITPPLAEPEPS